MGRAWAVWIVSAVWLLAAACGAPSGGSNPATGDDDDDDNDDNWVPPAACESIAGEGFVNGMVAEDWSLSDRDGNTVHLHDYCGRVVFFEDGSEW